ncbi:Zinc knuckle family protein [Ditylenchus destructor]|nr:Zinc knuckle family protein [Ditylenchus destructor]
MKLIDGIPLSHGNFQIVVDILKKRYDNRPQLITDLYSQLQKLEQASSLAKLKDLYFGFMRICRQLEVEGESPNHNPILWKIVYDKLSTQYLSKLLAKEPSATNWTAHSIQAAIWEVIEREEKIAEHKAEHRTERPSKDLNEREEEPDQHYTILSTMVDQKKRPEPQRSCSFCQGKDHWTDGCHKYPDYQTRVDRTRELHQCFKCLRTGHGSKKCKAKFSDCFHCKRRHNSALCREKFEQKRSDDQEQKPKDTKAQHLRFRRKEWHKPKVPKPAISSLEDSVAMKTGRKASTIQKSQAKVRTQRTINQVPVIVGHCTVLSQIVIESEVRTQKTQQIPKSGSDNKSSKRRRELRPERKTSTSANPNSTVKNEGPSKLTPYLVQKKMPTPLHPKVEKESHPAAHVSTPIKPQDQRRRQVQPETKVQHLRNMPKYCQSEGISAKNRQSTVPQLKNHTRGQKSHREWAIEVFYTKKHNLRNQNELEQYRD